MPDSPDGHELGRLAWRCRRGMKELDLLLGDYLQRIWPTASAAERDAFTRILDLQDPLLAAYLLGNARCNDESLAPLLATLQGLARKLRQAGKGQAGSNA